MADAAERLLAGTGWLPPLIRTEGPTWLADEPSDARATVEDQENEPFAVAAG